MKKLMIAAAIVCAAAFAQAGTVTWGSGTLNTASGKTGGWSDTSIATAEAEVMMQVFIISDAEVWSKVSGLDAKGMYDWSVENAASVSITKSTKNGDTYMGAASAQKTGTASQVQTFNALIVASYTDDEYGKMFMATTAPVTTNGSGTGQKQNIFGGTTGIKNWTAAAVPEPTSGLLLLLGVAGLALRRRRA